MSLYYFIFVNQVDFDFLFIIGFCVMNIFNWCSGDYVGVDYVVLFYWGIMGYYYQECMQILSFFGSINYVLFESLFDFDEDDYMDEDMEEVYIMIF